MKKNLKTEFTTRQYMLSQDFEIYYYSDRVLPNVTAHTHDYFEFFFFIEGNIIMYMDGKQFVPTPGTMIVIPPNLPHFARLIDGDVPYRRFVFWVTEDFLKTLGDFSEDYLYLTNKAKSSGNFSINKFNEIEFNTIQGKVFSLIDEIHANRFGRDAKIMLAVSDFIISINRMVFENQNPNVIAPDTDSLYQSLIQYIETHIDEDLSLDTLAEKLHVSKYHISHVFTDTNGLPLHKYITKKRLDMCRDAILSGQDISIVAAAYGFSDYSVFYRAFTKEYGKSPKKYRDEKTRING
ncbi:helix-turn-helix domain-containing protein [Pseudobutyrivibrio xylanivorans]|uniref:AraC-type DNA-binding protein n=1 Tax=Pseudobutyrivibrio xylanivorans DSM 14809 TaxID=1123012 RepID=A0A1M6FVS4_PSEXY|nr:AraC family transcriptional regulator [Pseudobutyrivibrio xylanivorans]SHJ01794.1 AraC-type DNA-binding protein [Pseudobutyrivibrio xylanivorans DSM 14809]